MLIVVDNRMIPLASIGYVEDRGTEGRIILLQDATTSPLDRIVIVRGESWTKVKHELLTQQLDLAPPALQRRRRVASAVPQ
jgi:hypothetical protein